MKNYEAKSVHNFSALLEQGKLKDFLLEQGQKLGYPFFVYANGECGKNLMTDDAQSEAYLKEYRLNHLQNAGDEKQRLFLDNKTLQEVRAEISSHRKLSEEGECILALYGAAKDLLGYLGYAKQLQMSSFQIIVERDCYRLLEMCAFGDLSVTHEVYLVQNGSRYLLSNYLRDYALSAEAELELVKRKDFELWNFYTQSGDFKPETYAYLRKVAEQDEKIALWLKGGDVY